MANRTLTQATALAGVDIASNDELWIWDVTAAALRKCTRADLIGGVITGGGTVATGGFTLTVPATGTAALLATAQTFTATPTMQSGVAIGVAAGLLSRPTAGVIRQQIEGVSIAADGTVTIATTAGRGLLYVYNATVGVSALAMLDGATSALIFGSTATFSLAADTANRLNLYNSGTNVIIQNKTAGALFVAAKLVAY